MKYTIALASLFFSFSVLAETSNWTYIKTPRGTDLEIKISKSLKSNAPLLIVAPGQSCNSKGPLFETIEQEATKREINVVRFEWSYCSPSSTNRRPSDDLSDEISDISFALNYSKDLLGKTNSDVLTAGKSLGSIVAYFFFKDQPELKTLTLLTPVCSYNTDDQGKPLPAPMEATAENYPNLLSETRPVLMISGNIDPLCDHAILRNFKAKAPKNIEVIYAQGDHGFSVYNADGSRNSVESQNSLLNVSANMLQWFSL